MQSFDDASRGPLGSVTFFWKGRKYGTLGLLTYVGCVLTIAAVALDPFAQQVISFPSKQTELDGEALVERSQVYDYGNKGWRGGLQPGMLTRTRKYSSQTSTEWARFEGVTPITFFSPTNRYHTRPSALTSIDLRRVRPTLLSSIFLLGYELHLSGVHYPWRLLALHRRYEQSHEVMREVLLRNTALGLFDTVQFHDAIRLPYNSI